MDIYFNNEIKRNGETAPIRVGKTKKYGTSTTTTEGTRNSIKIKGQKSKLDH